jgi:hypothetical protein
MEEILNEWFGPEKIAMYLTWIAYISTIVGFAANIKKLKKTNNLTLKNVSDDLKKLLKNEISISVSEQNDKYLPQILETQQKMQSIICDFAKVLALSQENTPESRVAILEIISNLGVVSAETIESSKKIIEEEVKSAEEQSERIDSQLDEIIDAYDGTQI